MAQAEAKWKKKELRERFILGVRNGEWEDSLGFWRKVLKDAGCPHSRFKSLRKDGNWDTEARLIVGQKNLLLAQDQCATEYSKLENLYSATAVTAAALMQDIARIRSKPDLKAAEVEKMMNATQKAQQISALALERPTSRDSNGAPTVLIRFTDEQTPYGKPIIGTDKPVAPALDEGHHEPSGKASGGERGEEDKEDRPVLQVAPVQDPDESVQGGGLVHSPVQDSGQDGGVEEAVAVAGGTATEADSGKDE
jgi:hypothetical protein